MMANAGVLDAAARFRVAEKMTRVAQRAFEQHTVGMAAAAADEKAHRIHH